MWSCVDPIEDYSVYDQRFLCCIISYMTQEIAVVTPRYKLTMHCVWQYT